jgi:hypothetical protein
MSAISLYDAYSETEFTFAKDSEMIAISKLSIIIILKSVHKINKIQTYPTATSPKELVSKSPNTILYTNPMAVKIVPPMKSEPDGLLELIYLIESPKAMKVKRSMRRK